MELDAERTDDERDVRGKTSAETEVESPPTTDAVSAVWDAERDVRRTAPLLTAVSVLDVLLFTHAPTLTLVRAASVI